MTPVGRPIYKNRMGTRRRAQKFFSHLSLILALLMGLWLVGFFFFAGQVADSASRSIGPDDRYADAIVVLTGGSERLEEGFDLLSQNLAKKLFVSGVYHGVDVVQLLKIFRQTPEELSCCVSLGYHAEDTEGNAYETARWMKENNFSSLRLVTANYHMPRSQLEFSHAMPDVEIIAHPVFPSKFHETQWWRWPGTARLLVSEYSKYLFARLRLLFFPAIPASRSLTSSSSPSSVGENQE